MKNILKVGAICLLSSMLLFGCAKNQDATITNLANQLDLLNNTVTSVSKTANEIPPLSSLTKQQTINYSGVYQSANEIKNLQTNYKTAILAKNGLIKSKIANDKLELSNQNIKALTDLTNSLSKDTKRLNETKSEFKTSLNDMKKVIDSSNFSTSQVSAKINRLSNCMDTQNCYYKNLLSTLNSIESILEIEDNSFDYSLLSQQNNYDSHPVRNNTKPDLEELLYSFLLQQNIQNLNKENNKNSTENKDKENYCEECEETPQTNFYPQSYIGYNRLNYGYNNAFNNRYYPFNTYTPYNYSNNMYGYSPYAYYGYGINRINPTRNTDSYRPWVVNIDTYRLPANQHNNPGIPVINKTETPIKNEQQNNDEIIDINNDTNQNINKINDDKDNEILEMEEKIDTQIQTKPFNETQSIKNKFLLKNKIKNKQNYKDNNFAGLTKKLNKNLSAFSKQDINKDIKDLIKKKTEEAFKNIENYVKIISF